ncbi:sugar phosphate isomerase/epimerase family protein [Neobacillus sp. PS3-34]|uniref:sugar phosphate isomerase/epimerase family protein n=1 Tax=Neobacillus sp. PS3-34 TaxID=3070678 RepID=UPI0027DEDB4F|nr:sugar phosphate isomerase/epimerase family protein [Neobacillus sp. PS3-34]WML48347.1 sugar phosphate isomerase/epimerase family protein [Neobacillus sp. PS3-34]
MNVSLSMWSVHKYWYDGTWNVIDFIDFVGTTKAKGVELLDIFWKNQKEELPLVESALKKYNLAVPCYAASNNFVSNDPEYRAQQLQEVKDAVDMAVHFGAKVVRVFSGNVDENISFEDGMKFILDGLEKASRYAEEKGVILCLENHGQFAGRGDQVLHIIQSINSPSLKSTFDAGNFLLVDQDPSLAVTELKDVVKHVHIKDFTKVDGPMNQSLKSLKGSYYLGKVAGEGEVDLPYILEKLKACGFDGWYTVEFEGTEEQKDGSIRAIDNTIKLLEKLASPSKTS